MIVVAISSVRSENRFEKGNQGAAATAKTIETRIQYGKGSGMKPLVLSSKYVTSATPRSEENRRL
jgi:hypothetical protein